MSEPSQTLSTYQRYFPEFTPSCFQQDMIESLVTNNDAWDKTLLFWASNNYRPQSIGKMLEYYDKLQQQPSGDWVADAVSSNPDADARLVEIAVLQVLISRFWNDINSPIHSVNYFKSAVDEMCGKVDKAVSEYQLTGRTVDVVLQLRREQFKKYESHAL